MANSYRKIDYRLRPAKAVERRMIAEYFQRLRPFAPVESYQYVGLGSVYFSDFSLFHNVCGFHDMVSIENVSDPTIRNRFDFNAPHGTIDLRFGTTNTELPKLDWTRASAVWLDFDGPLDRPVLTDISFLASKLVPHSMLLVSVNAQLNDEEEDRLGKLEVLAKRVGIERLPANLQALKTIPEPKIPELFRGILKNEIDSALNARNAGLEENDKLVAEQVMFFKYADGAVMLTIGWILIRESDRPQFVHCAFDHLPHSRPGIEPFFIDIPLLTNAEIRELNRCKVIDRALKADHLPLPPSEIKKYFALKRFWPLLHIPELT